MNDDSIDLEVDEDARRRFESAWCNNDSTRIEDFLPAPDSRSYLGTLEELVKIELEFAWKSGRFTAGASPRIESYLGRFPRLNAPAVTRRLLRQEYLIRHQYGDRPPQSEYVARFPRVWGQDAELPVPTGTQGTVGATATTTATTNGASAETTAAVPTPAGLPDLPRYEVLKVIGRGGMGIVLQARDRTLNRLVAIKQPLRGTLSKTEADRFLREARSVAKLRHPNICPIYEVGEHRRRPYIAMAYVQGPTLQAWARERGPTARACAAIIAKVARAVECAHEHGVIHRDIKPTNVLVEAASDEPLLTDFGLAKEVSSTESLVTQDGTVLGTPAYMSPEQAAGRGDEVGPPTDVYALGAVLYELLCGHTPFSGTVGEILRKVQTDTVVALRKRAPKVHRDLETICMKALAQERNSRYATARALAEDLERFSAGDAIHARREGAGRKVARVMRRHPRQAVSIAFAVLLAAWAVSFAARASSRTRKAAILRQQIEARIEAGDWADEEVANIDQSIAALADLDPQQAAAQRLRVGQALVQSITDLLREPTLSPQVVARLDREIRLLSGRDLQQAAAMQSILLKRRRAWETVYDLEPPFKNLKDFPDADLVRPEPGSLVFLPPDRLKRAGYAPLPLRFPCYGNVQFEIAVVGDWERMPLPILVLSGRGDPIPDSLRPAGHSFWIAGPDARVATVRAAGGTLAAGCAHDGVTLRAWRVKAADLAPGALRMVARRDGNKLALQINDMPPLEVEDAFSADPREGAVFTAYLAPGTRVRRLRANRQGEAAAPSPLEHGDRLYGSNRMFEALAAYQKQAIESPGGEAGQEARYKQALCLVALKRNEEAARAFEQVFAESGDRWPALAGCQLLSMRTRDRRAADADAIFRTLRARFSVDHLREIVPEPIRLSLLEDTIFRTFGVNMFARVTPEVIDELKRQYEINEILDPGTEGAGNAINMMRAYELAGDDGAALRCAEIVFRERPSPLLFRALEDYGCILRLRGDAPRAMRKVESLLLDPTGAYNQDCYPALVERARLRAAMGDPAGAEKDLDDYLRLGARLRQSYIFDGSAAVMRGFLREDRGDREGAAGDWRWGTLKNFAVRHEADPNVSLSEQLDGIYAMIVAFIDGSLADDLPDPEIDLILKQVLERYGGSAADAEARPNDSRAAFMFLARSGVIDFPVSTLREMWRTPRGRTLARKVIFRSLPLADLARQSVALGIYQTQTQGCLSGPISADQDAAFWEQSVATCDALRDHKLRKEQILRLFLTWRGNTGFLGWAQVEKTLDPDFRAGAAYVFGKRCLFLHQPEDAIKMFGQVLEGTPPDSRLHRLAQAELDMLEGPKK